SFEIVVARAGAGGSTDAGVSAADHSGETYRLRAQEETSRLFRRAPPLPARSLSEDCQLCRADRGCSRSRRGGDCRWVDRLDFRAADRGPPEEPTGKDLGGRRAEP